MADHLPTNGLLTKSGKNIYSIFEKVESGETNLAFQDSLDNEAVDDVCIPLNKIIRNKSQQSETGIFNQLYAIGEEDTDTGDGLAAVKINSNMQSIGKENAANINVRHESHSKRVEISVVSEKCQTCEDEVPLASERSFISTKHPHYQKSSVDSCIRRHHDIHRHRLDGRIQEVSQMATSPSTSDHYDQEPCPLSHIETDSTAAGLMELKEENGSSSKGFRNSTPILKIRNLASKLLNRRKYQENILGHDSVTGDVVRHLQKGSDLMSISVENPSEGGLGSKKVSFESLPEDEHDLRNLSVEYPPDFNFSSRKSSIKENRISPRRASHGNLSDFHFERHSRREFDSTSINSENPSEGGLGSKKVSFESLPEDEHGLRKLSVEYPPDFNLSSRRSSVSGNRISARRASHGNLPASHLGRHSNRELGLKGTNSENSIEDASGRVSSESPSEDEYGLKKLSVEYPPDFNFGSRRSSVSGNTLSTRRASHGNLLATAGLDARRASYTPQNLSGGDLDTFLSRRISQADESLSSGFKERRRSSCAGLVIDMPRLLLERHALMYEDRMMERRASLAIGTEASTSVVDGIADTVNRNDECGYGTLTTTEYGSISRLMAHLEFTNVKRYQRFMSVERRLAMKHGGLNVDNVNVPSYFSRLSSDIITSFVDASWLWNILLYSGVTILSWLAFAVVWYMIAYGNNDIRMEGVKTHKPCIIGVRDFITSLLHSIELETTMGYGDPRVGDHCYGAIGIMMFQLLAGEFIICILVGVFMMKIINMPLQGNIGVMFSKKAVICRRERAFYLVFRMGVLRKSNVVQGMLRAILITKHWTKEGELIPLHQRELKIGSTATFSEHHCNVSLLWPTLIHHPIDEESPFWGMSADDLEKSMFEIVVTLEGQGESVGNTLQANTSYLPWEIEWGHQFMPLSLSENPHAKYHADCQMFDSVKEVKMSRRSAKEANGMNSASSGSSSSESDDSDEEIGD